MAKIRCRMALGVVFAAALLATFAPLAHGQRGPQKRASDKDQAASEQYITFLKKYFNDGIAGAIAKSNVPPVLAKPIEPRAGDDELADLLKSRYNRAMAMAAQAYSVNAVNSGYDEYEDQRTLMWSRVLLKAGLEAHDRSHHQAFLTGMVEFCAKMTKRVEQRGRPGLETELYRLPEWEVFTLDVRIALAKAKKYNGPLYG